VTPTRVEVLFFAAAREAAGTPSLRLEVAPGTTVDALAAGLRARFPKLAAVGAVRFAVGERFADGPTVVADGDVVALIPPVSGG
jgi:molybdopterin converting factor subunit 1